MAVRLQCPHTFIEFSTNCSVRVSAHVKSVHEVQMESDKRWEGPHPLLLFQFIATAVYSLLLTNLSFLMEENV